MKTKPAKSIWAQLPPGCHLKRVGTGHPKFAAWIFRGGPGPVAVINGGTHGDEYEGPTVLRELIDLLDPRQIRGTLVIIPVLHEDAFFAGQRCHPQDGSNLARVFPGDPRGNQAARVADLFLNKVLSHADYYLDLHSGGEAYDLLPWCGYMITGRPEIDRVQAKIAACFDDYWCWGSFYAAGRTLSSAADSGVPAIYTECRGGGDVHPDDHRAMHRGLRNFLIRFGFIKGTLPRLKKPPVRIAQSKDEAHLQTHHPAPVDGLFIPSVTSGQVVRKNSLLGVIHPLHKSGSTKVRANQSGTVVCLRRQRSVTSGEALATLVALPA